MPGLVGTIFGLLPRDSLEVKDIITEGPGYRKIDTQFYRNGELVRNDVWVNLLVAQPLVGEQTLVENTSGEQSSDLHLVQSGAAEGPPCPGDDGSTH